MSDLEHYYTSLYDEAEFYVSWRRVLFIILFIVLGFSIYAKDIFLYIATLSVVVLQIAIWILKIKIDSSYQLAHNFQKHEMLSKLVGYDVDISEVINLKQKVSLYVTDRVNQKKIKI